MATKKGWIKKRIVILKKAVNNLQELLQNESIANDYFGKIGNLIKIIEGQ